MGISLSWVAVQALPADEALHRLSLSRTGKHGAYPFKGVACHTLPAEWFLVAAGRCNHRIITPTSLSLLTRGVRAVACSIEEHVNFASARLWDNGQCIWQVRHQGDEDDENIAFEGSVPQRFHELLASVEPQGSEDLDGHFHMDIPLILAKELCFFRHDESNSDFDSTPFELLAETTAKRGWWPPW